MANTLEIEPITNRIFSIDGVTFEYRLGKRALLRNVETKKTSKSVKGVWIELYLPQLLKAAPDYVNFEDENNVVNTSTTIPRKHHAHIAKIRNSLKELLPEGHPKKLKKGWPILSNNGMYTISIHDETPPLANNKDLSTYGISSNAASKASEDEFCGEQNVQRLISALVKIYPDELREYFYKLNNELHLPFYLMDPSSHGNPSFPLDINDSLASEITLDRGQDSFLKMRRSAEKTLYNGSLYRLYEATEKRWELARADYFTTLDSCDYLRHHIFREWGEGIRKGLSEHRLQIQLKKSKYIAEWLGHVCAIRKGDFSGYCASMAFTMPVFSVNGEGLTLLLSKGSTKKATGGGKYHCCPSGMLEYYRNTITDHLSFDDLRTYLTKEMIEETLSEREFVEKDIQARLNGESTSGSSSNTGGDRYDLRYLERIFDQLSKKWSEENQITDLFDAVRNLREDSSNAFYVVDAFRLRPEIILPFYLKQPIQLFTNWEFEGELEDIRTFQTLDDLESQISLEIPSWAEPGLAAAVLGGENWFNKM